MATEKKKRENTKNGRNVVRELEIEYITRKVTKCQDRIKTVMMRCSFKANASVPVAKVYYTFQLMSNYVS